MKIPYTFCHFYTLNTTWVFFKDIKTTTALFLSSLWSLVDILTRKAVSTEQPQETEIHHHWRSHKAFWKTVVFNLVREQIVKLVYYSLCNTIKRTGEDSEGNSFKIS